MQTKLYHQQYIFLWTIWQWPPIIINKCNNQIYAMFHKDKGKEYTNFIAYFTIPCPKPTAYFSVYQTNVFLYYFKISSNDLDRHDDRVTWNAFHITGLWPLLLTWVNLNPSMDHMPGKVWEEITYPFLNFNGATVEA